MLTESTPRAYATRNKRPATVSTVICDIVFIRHRYVNISQHDQHRFVSRTPATPLHQFHSAQMTRARHQREHLPRADASLRPCRPPTAHERRSDNWVGW